MDQEARRISIRERDGHWSDELIASRTLEASFGGFGEAPLLDGGEGSIVG